MGTVCVAPLFHPLLVNLCIWFPISIPVQLIVGMLSNSMSGMPNNAGVIPETAKNAFCLFLSLAVTLQMPYCGMTVLIWF